MVETPLTRDIRGLFISLDCSYAIGLCFEVQAKRDNFYISGYKDPSVVQKGERSPAQGLATWKTGQGLVRIMGVLIFRVQ